MPEIGPVNDPKNDPQFEAIGICHTCARRKGMLTCEAFPERIPTDVLVGDFLHVRPYPGDRGLQYVKLQA